MGDFDILNSGNKKSYVSSLDKRKPVKKKGGGEEDMTTNK